MVCSKQYKGGVSPNLGTPHPKPGKCPRLPGELGKALEGHYILVLKEN